MEKINAFDDKFVNVLREASTAIFACAVLSISDSFVDWKELLNDIV
jgi:hypothetical protein